MLLLLIVLPTVLGIVSALLQAIPVAAG